jgi:hypothetical protein
VATKAFVAPGSELAATIDILRSCGCFSDYAPDVEAWSGLPTDDPGALEVLLIAPGACSKCGGGRIVKKV